MRLRPLALALALAALLPLSAAAQDADGMFSFSGFATLGVVHSTEDKADFVPLNPPTGAGHTASWSTTPDSRVAAQVDAKFTDRFSGVVQVISEYGVRNSYRPDVELAHLKYAFTPALAIRAGRMIGPMFMLSEYQKVGYAVPWVRPPAEVYNNAISLDGVDLTYKFNVGDVALTVQAAAGSANENTFEISDARVLNAHAEFGSTTLFASYNTVRVDVINPQLTSLLGYYRPSLSALADRYEVKNDKVTFASVGYAYDPGSWFARAEVTRTSGEQNLLTKTTNMYASAGRRLGAFTPYATYAKVNVDSPTSIGAADPIGVINAGLASGNEARQSLTIGSRWDFRESAAMKLEFSHVDGDAGSNGGLVNLQPDFVRGGSYNLLSASVDFVF